MLVRRTQRIAVVGDHVSHAPRASWLLLLLLLLLCDDTQGLDQEIEYKSEVLAKEAKWDSKSRVTRLPK